MSTLLKTKPARIHLGFVVQLKVFLGTGRFPGSESDAPSAGIGYLAEQLKCDPKALDSYDWTGRSGRRHRIEILSFLGFRRIRRRNREVLEAWMNAELCPRDEGIAAMVEQAFIWLRDRKIFGLPEAEIERMARSVRRRFDDSVFTRIVGALSPEATKWIEDSLEAPDGLTGFTAMKADPGRVALDSVLRMADRLAFIRSLDPPRQAFDNVATSWIERFVQRVSQECAWRMRRHAPTHKLGIYALFLMAREAEITDDLVDLLIETKHKIGAKSERSVAKALAAEIQRVTGKETLLANIAAAAIDDPDSPVRRVIFPVASEKTLAAIIREHQARGSWGQQVQAKMRASFAGHYRPMLPRLLSVLEFRSNNATHRPILDAPAWISRSTNDRRRVIHEQDGVPIDGVLPARWRDLVIEKDGRGRTRINRISYELCVLAALRERIRCKEIWVVGADRYRNPDDDQPKDFEERRAHYFSDLGLGQDAGAYTATLRAEMPTVLRTLGSGLPGNKGVRLIRRGANRISVSPSIHCQIHRVSVRSRWRSAAAGR